MSILEGDDTELNLDLIVCGQCGSRLDPTDRFCIKCGTKIPIKLGATHSQVVDAVSQNYETEYAGLLVRVLANFVDGLILIPIILFFNLYVVKYAVQIRSILPFLLYYILIISYYTFFIVRKGGTPGKLIMNLRIVDESKSYVSVSKALLRQLPVLIIVLITLGQLIGILTISTRTSLYLTDLIIFIDGLVAWRNKKNRALHDFIAGTYVIQDKSTRDNL